MKPDSISPDTLLAADRAAMNELVNQVLPPGDLRALSDDQIDSLLSRGGVVPVDVSGLLASIGGAGDSRLLTGREIAPPISRSPMIGKWVALVCLLVIAVGWSLRPFPSAQGDSEMDAELEEWQVDFPPPVFVGTPPATIPGLIDPYGNPIMGRAPQLSLRLPPDAQSNVALGKRVVSSAPLPFEGGLGSITDGIRSSDATVTLESGPQWVQLDLASTHEIYGVVVWHDYSMQIVASDVVVSVSDDPDFENGVTEIFNNSLRGIPEAEIKQGSDSPYVETNFGLVIEAHGVTGRYVRLYSNGSSQGPFNRYTEVETYGRELPVVK
ncbi:MAG: hypothetical protein ACI9R3_005255 [Verrucomicrobiales bacterium]|jgi:hypothetical protein